MRCDVLDNRGAVSSLLGLPICVLTSVNKEILDSSGFSDVY